MKKILIAVMICCMVLPVYAKHIRGGELSYKYIGPGTAPNTSQ